MHQRARQLLVGRPTRPVTAQLRQLFAAYPTTDHFLFEYLRGLDHAIRAYARRADDTDLNEANVLFAGFADYLAQLTAHHQEQGTALANELRGDEHVVELLDNWFDDCWQAAGGAELPVASYCMCAGDSSLLNLQTQQWQEDLCRWCSTPSTTARPIIGTISQSSCDTPRKRVPMFRPAWGGKPGNALR